MSPSDRVVHPHIYENMSCDTLTVKMVEKITNRDMVQHIPLKIAGKSHIQNEADLHPAACTPKVTHNGSINGYSQQNGVVHTITDESDSQYRYRPLNETNTPDKLLDRRKKYNSMRNEFYKRSQNVLSSPDSSPTQAKIVDEQLNEKPTTLISRYKVLSDNERNTSAGAMRRNRKYDHIQSKIDTNLRKHPSLTSLDKLKGQEKRIQSAIALNSSNRTTSVDNLSILNQRRISSARNSDVSKYLEPIERLNKPSHSSNIPDEKDSYDVLFPNTLEAYKTLSTSNLDKLNFYSARFCRERLKKDKSEHEKEAGNTNMAHTWRVLQNERSFPFGITPKTTNVNLDRSHSFTATPSSTHVPLLSQFTPTHSKRTIPPTKSEERNGNVVKCCPNGGMRCENGIPNNINQTIDEDKLKSRKEVINGDLAFLRSSYDSMSDQLRNSTDTSDLSKTPSNLVYTRSPRAPVSTNSSTFNSELAPTKVPTSGRAGFRLSSNAPFNVRVDSAQRGSLTEEYLKDVNNSISKYLSDQPCRPAPTVSQQLNIGKPESIQEKQDSHKLNEITPADVTTPAGCKSKERCCEYNQFKEHLSESSKRLGISLPCLSSKDDSQPIPPIARKDDSPRTQTSIKDDSPRMQTTSIKDDSLRIQTWLDSLSTKQREDNSQHSSVVWDKYNNSYNDKNHPVSDLLKSKWMSQSMPSNLNNRSILKKKKRVRINLKFNKIYFYTPEYEV